MKLERLRRRIYCFIEESISQFQSRHIFLARESMGIESLRPLQQRRRRKGPP